MKSKFSTDNSIREAFLQVVLGKKSTDDNKFQEILNNIWPLVEEILNGTVKE